MSGKKSAIWEEYTRLGTNSVEGIVADSNLNLKKLKLKFLNDAAETLIWLLSRASGNFSIKKKILLDVCSSTANTLRKCFSILDEIFLWWSNIVRSIRKLRQRRFLGADENRKRKI